MKVVVVEPGFVLQDGQGVLYSVTHEYPIACNDEIFTTADAYEETLVTLNGSGVIGSRFVQ